MNRAVPEINDLFRMLVSEILIASFVTINPSDPIEPITVTFPVSYLLLFL